MELMGYLLQPCLFSTTAPSQRCCKLEWMAGVRAGGVIKNDGDGDGGVKDRGMILRDDGGGKNSPEEINDGRD